MQKKKNEKISKKKKTSIFSLFKQTPPPTTTKLLQEVINKIANIYFFLIYCCFCNQIYTVTYICENNMIFILYISTIYAHIMFILGPGSCKIDITET